MIKKLLIRYEPSITQSWYQQPPRLLTYALLPLVGVYRAIACLHRWVYELGIKKIIYFPVPVIAVGNITVGGTGKTPLVIYLAEFFKQQGYKPGIVSRGYGGTTKIFPHDVDADSNPIHVGDEAVLLAQRTQCPVVIAPNRVKAAQRLLQRFRCDLILSDDGLQHYALGKKVSIVVLDGKRRLGNGFCLPAGPLREPKERLHKADFIVCNGNAESDEFAMHLQMRPIYQLINPQQQLDIAAINTPVHAVTAIGNPARFFNALRSLGLTIVEHAFPDHYLFQPNDFNFAANDIIIMTEKDAVKCRRFAGPRYWCLPIDAECPEHFTNLLLAAVKK